MKPNQKTKLRKFLNRLVTSDNSVKDTFVDFESEIKQAKQKLKAIITEEVTSKANAKLVSEITKLRDVFPSLLDSFEKLKTSLTQRDIELRKSVQERLDEVSKVQKIPDFGKQIKEIEKTLSESIESKDVSPELVAKVNEIEEIVKRLRSTYGQGGGAAIAVVFYNGAAWVGI